MRQIRNPLIVLFVAGIAVHACMLLAVHYRKGAIDHYAFASLDAREYYQNARNLLQHGTLSVSQSEPIVPDTWRTPGYPLVLAAAMSLVGESPITLVLFQQLLSIFNVMLFYVMMRSWMSKERSLVVSLLLLIEPYHLYYSLWLLATTPFLTFLLLTWMAWQRALIRGQLRWVLGLSVTCGFLVLVRPIAAFVPVALVLGLMLWAMRRHRLSLEDQSERFPWQAVPTFAMVCTLVVGSWMMRNYTMTGYLAPSDQSGVVLAYFKAAEVQLWKDGRTQDRYLETSLNESRLNDPHPVWDAIDERLQKKMSDLPEDVRATLTWRNLAQGNRSQANSFAVSESLRQIAVEDLSQSPISAVSCYLVRCFSILTFPMNLAIRPPNGIEGNRLFWFLKSIPYLVLLIWALISLFRNATLFEQVFFPLVCLFALLVATTPQLDPRFRVPMIPLLLAIAMLPHRRYEVQRAESPYESLSD